METISISNVSIKISISITIVKTIHLLYSTKAGNTYFEASDFLKEPFLACQYFSLCIR